MANRYWVGGNDTWDATAGTKWALTSGGAGGQAVPTTSDDVFFDAASGAVTVTMGTGYTANALNLNFTGFTGTLAGSGSFGIASGATITFSAGMTITCTGNLGVSNATLTSAGKTWTGNFSASTAATTITLTEDFRISGNFETNQQGSKVLNGVGFTFYVGGNFDISSMNTGIYSGTASFNLNGSGTVTTPTGRTAINVTVSGSYTLTTNWRLGGGTLTISVGATLNTSTFAVQIFQASQTIDANANTLGKLEYLSAGITLSLASELKISSSITCTVATAASPSVLNSTSGTQKLTLLNNGATQDIGFLNVTNINSGDGQTLWNWGGTLSGTTNWLNLTTPKTVGYASVV